MTPASIQKPTSFYFILSPYFARGQDEDEQAKNAFLDAFIALPEPLQDFITAPGTADTLEGIGDMFNLSLSQTEIISFLVREVVLGRLPLKELPTSIAQQCSIEIPLAWQVANTIAAKLLMPIKDELAHAQAQRPTSQTPPATPSAPTPTGQEAQAHNIIDLRTKP